MYRLQCTYFLYCFQLDEHVFQTKLQLLYSRARRSRLAGPAEHVLSLISIIATSTMMARAHSEILIPQNSDKTQSSVLTSTYHGYRYGQNNI